MKYKIIITALMTLFTLPVLADFVTVSKAYELQPDRVSVPVAASSRILFSDCDGCEATSAQLTDETRFSVNGKRVDFERFCDAVRQAQQSERTGIFLQHHLKSDTVISVSVSL